MEAFAGNLGLMEEIQINVFDEEEIHENCTVQILRNSITGEISIGWWENDPEVGE